ncbi:hypothetical protein FO675_10965 [Riemerella anatipestifer]|uniref:hypothetical protein n=1 Tax=Riemerella anatipestifer TaxID=34085 RepID=UPI001AD640F7|nr:hypothetical protein [Riemerella anatipestifer]MBO4234799.1 hypothetical protein [Riemerella anatipestifer]
MKKILLAVFLTATVTVSKAQSIVGRYEQSTLVAPDAYRDSEDDVTISKDPKSSKKIWISNLIPNQKIYAVLHTKGNGNLIYSVPKQLVGNYQINIGCVTFKEHDEDEEDEEGKLIISLNNEKNCFGISQKDYDAPVSIGKGGVRAGGVTVGSNGTISAGGVDIKKGNIKVNPKEVMSGIQYIGYKIKRD